MAIFFKKLAWIFESEERLEKWIWKEEFLTYFNTNNLSYLFT